MTILYFDKFDNIEKYSLKFEILIYYYKYDSYYLYIMFIKKILKFDICFIVYQVTININDLRLMDLDASSNKLKLYET